MYQQEIVMGSACECITGAACALKRQTNGTTCSSSPTGYLKQVPTDAIRHYLPPNNSEDECVRMKPLLISRGLGGLVGSSLTSKSHCKMLFLRNSLC